MRWSVAGLGLAGIMACGMLSATAAEEPQRASPAAVRAVDAHRGTPVLRLKAAPMASAASATSSASAAADLVYRASVGLRGIQLLGQSYFGDFSDDGRIIGFSSTAAGLSGNFDGAFEQAYVRDRIGGVTELVSVLPSGRSERLRSAFMRVAGNGRFVLFDAQVDEETPKAKAALQGCYRRDRTARITVAANPGRNGARPNGDCSVLGLTTHGRYALFSSNASNLVAGDTNAARDLFVRDFKLGITTRESVGPGGVQADGFSYDGHLSRSGRWLAMVTWAGNLAAGDTNGWDDVYLRDRTTGRTERVSVGDKGQQGNLWSTTAAVSSDGRFVAFSSYSSNLVPGDSNAVEDIFLRDRRTKTTRRINLGRGGAQADQSSFVNDISDDGRIVVFTSSATTLVPTGQPAENRVYLWDAAKNAVRRVDVAADGTMGDAYAINGKVTADGSRVGFSSDSALLVPGDGNATTDAFVRAVGP